MKTNDLPAGTAAFNFRVMKRESGKGAAKTVTYGIYLCWYAPDGHLVKWERNIAAPLGYDFRGLAIDVYRISEALVLPILDFATGGQIEDAHAPSDISMIIAQGRPANDRDGNEAAPADC